MMELLLEGLEADCVIGDLPEERTRTQRLVVDAAIEIDMRAAETDLLSDTVDYAEVAKRVRAALAAAKCRMIERAAKVAAEAILSERAVRAVTVTVRKSGAVPGLGRASARLRVRRDGRP